jgi:hypothetical protein
MFRHWRSIAGLSCGSGVCTNAARVSILMPQEIEKKETMEGRFFIESEATRAHYTTSRIPQGS